MLIHPTPEKFHEIRLVKERDPNPPTVNNVVTSLPLFLRGISVNFWSQRRTWSS